MSEQLKPTVMLPSDLERRQIFYWIKKVSSVTAWRRIFGYYMAWANSVENSLRIADANGWADETSLPQSEYVLVLKCLAHCEEGVRRLASGDKRVFKFDANGEFVMAMRMLSHWHQMLERVELGENRIQKNTPLWDEFCDALNSLVQVWRECGPHILERRYFEDPALVLYGKWLQKELATMSFPNQLPPVPDPLENVFVATKQRTPYSGIWEPVDVPKPSMLSLIISAPKPQPPFKIMGAMNYLHGGSDAPQLTVETADDSLDLNVTWRLLWRDDRYLDNSVPDEETHYKFEKPDLMLPTAPKIWMPKETIWSVSGAPAPIAGRWLAENYLNASVVLGQGEILPMHDNRQIRWVLADN